MTTKNLGEGFTGQRVGGDPENEEDNFLVCEICGQAVDMRRLDQVFHHMESEHQPIPLEG